MVFALTGQFASDEISKLLGVVKTQGRKLGAVERLNVHPTDLNDLEGRIDFLASQGFVERGFHDVDFGRDSVAFFGTGHQFTKVFDDAVGKA